MSESTLNFCRGCDANVTAGGQIAEVLPDGGAKGEPRTSMDRMILQSVIFRKQ